MRLRVPSFILHIYIVDLSGYIWNKDNIIQFLENGILKFRYIYFYIGILESSLSDKFSSSLQSNHVFDDGKTFTKVRGACHESY